MTTHEAVRLTDDSATPDTRYCPRCSARLFAIEDIDDGRVRSCLLCGYSSARPRLTPDEAAAEAATAMRDRILRTTRT